MAEIEKKIYWYQLSVAGVSATMMVTQTVLHNFHYLKALRRSACLHICLYVISPYRMSVFLFCFLSFLPLHPTPQPKKISDRTSDHTVHFSSIHTHTPPSLPPPLPPISFEVSRNWHTVPLCHICNLVNKSALPDSLIKACGRSGRHTCMHSSVGWHECHTSLTPFWFTVCMEMSPAVENLAWWIPLEPAAGYVL